MRVHSRYCTCRKCVMRRTDKKTGKRIIIFFCFMMGFVLFAI